MGGTGRAVPDRAAGVLDGALGVPGALADADQGEADPGVPDDLDQPRAGAAGVPVEPVQEVFGPADVVPGAAIAQRARVGLIPVVEAQHVNDAELAAHHRVLQSTTHATGHAVPHAWQVRAISVMPS